MFLDEEWWFYLFFDYFPFYMFQANKVFMVHQRKLKKTLCKICTFLLKSLVALLNGQGIDANCSLSRKWMKSSVISSQNPHRSSEQYDQLQCSKKSIIQMLNSSGFNISVILTLPTLEQPLRSVLYSATNLDHACIFSKNLVVFSNKPQSCFQVCENLVFNSLSVNYKLNSWPIFGTVKPH